MPYRDPNCAYCPPSIRACRRGEEAEKGPGWCPTKVDPEGVAEGTAAYDDPALAKIAKVAALIEAEGYCRWTRVEETCEFAKRMGFRKVGIAHCMGSIDLANVFAQVLESHGLEVVSVCCKCGGVPKERVGVADAQKIRPGQHESMCNSIAQAKLLNRAGSELNVLVGLCVGHDALFAKHSEALVTTLVAKDRALGHNPAAALLYANGYSSRIWGPHRPAEPPTKPAEGRSGGNR